MREQEKKLPVANVTRLFLRPDFPSAQLHSLSSCPIKPRATAAAALSRRTPSPRPSQSRPRSHLLHATPYYPYLPNFTSPTSTSKSLHLPSRLSQGRAITDTRYRMLLSCARLNASATPCHHSSPDYPSFASCRGGSDLRCIPVDLQSGSYRRFRPSPNSEPSGTT
ncbi:hypothetical protein BGZ61DRAFT_61940 [Ilyonectria robusta]|uniref:uncharacterized protein n=1 Tax=Ilyonectria robusta TaxID=1079257 RepID=UPI001E8EDEF2|nr:uncharacterized protein BGZ61DRAFT_61940 [Ilyonectria robusta]KAH8683440.1 hypothetical protein BGZ61DRAFT_61940 [Ilyonectria robusta]